MADNILTKDRASVDLDIAAKEIGAVKYPRNILVDPSGADLTPASEATMQSVLAAIQTLLTNAQLRATALPTVDAQLVETNSRLQGLETQMTDLLTLSAGLPFQGLHQQAEDTLHTTGASGSFVLAVRSDADTAAAGNGDYTPFQTDEFGRLKVSSQPASYNDITGDITAIQPVISTPVAGGTVVGDVSRASNVMAFCTGTFAGINVTFEGSLEATGDTNWFGVQAVRTNANTIETATGALSATPAYAWELSVNALARLRVRATARTSGTQSWRFKLGTYATEPIPAAQVSATQPVSGTVTVNGTVTANQATPTPLNINSAANTNLTAVKASAGTLYGLVARNTGAGAAFIKLYNKASAPVVATDVPVLVIEIAAGGLVQVNFAAVGHRFATGIALAITGAQADTDATAVAAGQVRSLLSFV